MTKQLTALLAATLLSVVALAGPVAAADPEPDDTEQEEASDERLGESSTTEEVEPKEEKKEEEAESWVDDFVSKSAWAPGAIYSMVAAVYANGGFYDPDGDIPIDEPGQGQEGKRSSEPGFPGSEIVLADR